MSDDMSMSKKIAHGKRLLLDLLKIHERVSGAEKAETMSDIQLQVKALERVGVKTIFSSPRVRFVVDKRAVAAKKKAAKKAAVAKKKAAKKAAVAKKKAAKKAAVAKKKAAKKAAVAKKKAAKKTS